MPPVDVDQHVGAGVGDVEQIGRIVGRAERRDLVGGGGPSRGREIVLHRFRDGVTVGVVRRQVGGLLVLAEGLDQDRADRRGRGLAVEVLAETVAHTILAGRVVRSGDAADEQHLLALCQLVQCDRDRARRAAGDHHRLVFADEALLRLHRLVRLGGGIRDAVLQFLAEHALGGLGRYLLDQLMAAVDVLDRELIALEFVFALHRVGAGARHADADEHRGTGLHRPDRCRSRAVRRRRPAPPCPASGRYQQQRRRPATACGETTSH